MSEIKQIERTCLSRLMRNELARNARTVLIVLLALGAWSLLSTDAAAERQTGDTDADCDVDLDDLNNLLNRFLEEGEWDIDAVNNWRNNLGAGELVAPPAPASGGTLYLTPVVSSVFSPADPSVEAVWEPSGGGALIVPGQGPLVAQIDLLMSIGDLPRSGAVGWGNVHFDVSIGGNVTEGYAGVPIGYLNDRRTVDHDADPATPNTLLYLDNADYGEPGDLLGIVSGVWPWRFGPEGIDVRRTLGQSAPERLGAVVVTIDSDIVGTSGSVETIVQAFSTYDENLVMGRNDGDMTGGLVTISVPEADCIAGDTRLCDGRVNIDDLNRLRNNFGDSGPDDGTLAGDTFPFDGVVNVDDLNNLRNHFGAQAAPALVPEPATWLSFICGIVFCAAGLRGACRQT